MESRSLTYCDIRDYSTVMFRFIRHFTKIGIVFSVIGAAWIGYLLGYPTTWPTGSLIIQLCVSLFFLSAGSLSLNQVQEWKQDSLMPRTQHRPIPAGQISPSKAFLLSFAMIVLGLVGLYHIHIQTALWGLLSVVLYNGFYTIYWKPKLKWGAVPGALPGALPLIIGYSVHNQSLGSLPLFYAFLILFFWQMPHFWTLALKYTKDYQLGSFPVLNVIEGRLKTQLFIGGFLVAYLFVVATGLALLSKTWMFTLVVVPFSLKLSWDYFRFLKHPDIQWERNFFIGVNISLIPFLLAPIIDTYFYLTF